MITITKKWTLGKWIHDKETRHDLVFQIREIEASFPQLSPQELRNGLHRYAKAGRINAVHRGVYVIVPAKYESRGGLPPAFYMDSLMRTLGRPYYFGLLSAARIWGASHQMPMIDTVVTIRPDMSASRRKNPLVAWRYRESIPESFVIERKGEYDRVRYSNPALTSLDLVRFENAAGGLSRVASVLYEFADGIDFAEASSSGLLEAASIPVAQRLGFILDEVLGFREPADSLFCQLKMFSHGRLKCVPLDRNCPAREAMRNRKWNVSVNCEIEMDEIQRPLWKEEDTRPL